MAVRRALLALWCLMLAVMGMVRAESGADDPTSPTLAQRSYPEVEALLTRVAAGWSESQSLRFECELDYILKGTNTEKKDHFRVDLRARKPNHIVAKAYNNGSIIAIVYDGEFVFTHTVGNRFSKAPLTGDLKTLMASGRLASYPMILLELYVADSPGAFLNQFEAASVEKGATDGSARVHLQRRREHIVIDLSEKGGRWAPVTVHHEWKFDPDTLAQTDPNLQLYANERYTRVDSAQPIPLDELNVRNVAMELMKELGIATNDTATTATPAIATPSAPAPPPRAGDAATVAPRDPSAAAAPAVGDHPAEKMIPAPQLSDPMEP